MRWRWTLPVVLCLVLIIPAGSRLASAQDSTPAPLASPEDLTAEAASPARNTVSFTAAVIDNTFRHGQQVEVNDMDADGDADMVLASSLDDAIYLYVNEGAGASDAGTPAPGTPIPGAFTRVDVAAANSLVAMQTASADYDGDGDLDVAAVGLFDRSCAFCAPGVVRWYSNPGAADPDATATDAAWTENIIAERLWGARTIAAADVDGDGDADVVVGTVLIEGNGGGLVWYQNQGSTWDGPLPVDPTLAYVEGLVVADVAGDALPDVIAASSTGDTVVWYENLGAIPEVTFIQREIGPATRPYDLALLPLPDGPGLLVTSDEGLLLFEAGGAPGEPWARTVLDAGYGVNGSARLAVADYNGDGLLDVAVTTNNRGAAVIDFRWYAQTDDGTWTPNDITPVYTGLTDAASADVNGDGYADLVGVTYNNSGSADLLAVWLNAP